METNLNTALVAVTVLALEEMSEDALYAAYAALTGFGAMNPAHTGFDDMKKAELIDEEGRARELESLLAALKYEIERREEEAGT